MASSSSSTLTLSISRPNYPFLSTRTTALQLLKFHNQLQNNSISCIYSLSKQLNKLRSIKVSASAEEEATLAPVEESSDQTVSVPVSPSDVLTMFFQADGTLSDAAVPTVTKALEEVEGVSDLKVQVLEGIASVELTKQTTVQATGVASNLVEIMQGSGFKLQTLNLSFQDEEDFS